MSEPRVFSTQETDDKKIDRLILITERNREDIVLLKKAVLGNGSFDHALVARVQRLEHLIDDAPTWKFITERALLPLALAIAGLILGHLLASGSVP